MTTAGGWATVGGVCKSDNIALSCFHERNDEVSMGVIMAHEIGHLLGEYGKVCSSTIWCPCNQVFFLIQVQGILIYTIIVSTMGVVHQMDSCIRYQSMTTCFGHHVLET